MYDRIASHVLIKSNFDQDVAAARRARPVLSQHGLSHHILLSGFIYHLTSSSVDTAAYILGVSHRGSISSERRRSLTSRPHV